ncbi:hypothetical protein E4N81_00775 [Treponema denticola]|uniref:hypothetical protein n=1 Tax=Treponema denticola TaxID=158 RepID=UPI003D6F395B
MIGKRLKSTAGSYNHSHKKSTKSFAKGLDKAETNLIIFSDKRQATSDKRQATSDKRQATSDKRQATKRHKNPFRSNKFTAKYKFSHNKPHAQEQIPVLVRFLHYTFNKTA